MAVDRGGLEYPIDVQDQFSANLKKFQEETRKAAKEWEALRDEMARTASTQRTLRQPTGASPAVRAAREERALAAEKAKLDRQSARDRTQALRDEERARQAIRRSIQQDRALDIRSRRLARDSAAESERLRAQEAATRARVLAEEDRAQRRAQRLRDDALRREEAAAKRRQDLAARQARIEQRAAQERARAAVTAETLEDRRASSAARRAAAERAAALRVVAAQERVSSIRQQQQQRADREQQRLNERQEAAQIRNQERQLAGAARIFAINERTRQAEEAAQRKAERDQEASVRARIAAERAAQRERERASRQEEIDEARRKRTSDQEEARRLRLEESRRRAVRQQERITRETQQSSRAAGQLLFTFRRLVGILAVFTAARVIARGLVDAVRLAIQFNSALEDSVLGIQSLIAATSEVASAQGRILSDAEKFAAANAEARRQVALLRVEGLKTAATFDQLLFAFQSALGPGIQAGLSPDEIRGFAVRIAQAAAAIGLPQNQLQEEVRSILAGTIQQRTTRIAAVLGIGNEDIKRAKEAGELADFLLDRFSAFQFAGEASLQNFSVIVANLRDATAQLLGEGGQDFFQQLRDGLRSVLATLIQTTDQGTIINPQALDIVRAFFSILTNIGEALGRIFESFTLSGAVETAQTVAATVNTAVNLLSTFAASFLSTFVDALNTVQGIAQSAAGIARELGFLDDSFVRSLRDAATFWGNIVGFILIYKTTILALRAPTILIATALRGVALVVRSLVPALTVLRSLFTVAAVKVGLIVTALVAVGGAIAFVVAAFNSDFVRSIEVAGLKIGTIADAIKLVLTVAVQRAALFFRTAWASSIAFVRSLFVKVANFFLDTILSITQKILDISGIFSEAAATAARNIANARKALEGAEDAELAAIEKRRQAELSAIEEVRRANQRAAQERINQIIEAEQRGPRITPQEAANRAIEAGRRLFENSQERVEVEEESVELVDQYIETFKELPAVIGQSNLTLEEQAKILERLNASVESAREGLTIAFATQDLEGVESRLLTARLKAVSEVQKLSKEFDARITTADAALTNIQNKEASIEATIRRQNVANQQQINDLVSIGSALSDSESQRRAAETSLKALITERNLALRSGDEERAASIENRLELVRQEIEAETEFIQLQEEALRLSIQNLQLSQEEGEKLLSQITELIRLSAQYDLLQTQLTETVNERGRIQEAVDAATEDRQRTLLILERQRLEVAERRAVQELENARLIDAAAQATRGITGEFGGTEAESRRAIAQAQVQFNTVRNQTAELSRQFELKKLALEAEKEATENIALQEEIQSRINSLQDEFNTNLELSVLEATQITEEILRLTRILNQPITAGLEAGLDDFIIKAGDSFTQVRQIAETAITGLADTISQTLADALDPTKDLDLLGRFQAFFNQITQMVLQLVTRLLLVKAITAALGLDTSQGDRVAAEAAASKAIVAAAAAAAAAAEASAAAASAAAFAASGAATGGIGAADGGLIGSKLPGTLGASFARAQGLAAGGAPQRPKGLHPSDRIPIWAALGEFMQPVAAVRKYGIGFMEAVRSGSLDANLARAMAGTTSASRVRTVAASSGPGYQTGGSIRENRNGTVGTVPQTTIINVFNEQELLTALASTEGQEVVVNVVNSRQDDIRTTTL